MNLDKFSRRRNPGSEAESGSPEYDFSSIAEAAVSDMRAQQNAADSWSDNSADPFAPRTFDEPPRSKRKVLTFGRKSEGSDPWDQPVDAGEALASAQREQKLFGRRRSFGFGKIKGNAQPDQFDRPRDRDSISDDGEPRRRRSFGFGKDRNEAQPDRFDRLRDRNDLEENDFIERSDHGSDTSSRAGFRRREASIPPASHEPAMMDAADDFDDDLLDFDDSADVPAPVSPEPERRVFNAATQPNYSYMTDYSEAPEPVSPASESRSGGVLDSVRSTLRIKLGLEDPNATYYTPPANRAPSDVRRRQKRRNRKPLASWIKASLFGLGLTAAFLLIVFIAFYCIVTGRLNYVGDSNQNPVYLSVEEYANLKADLTDTEENAAEFTEPVSFAEPDEDIKVIMLVSSDSRIGDVHDPSGKKITNESAKADSIMLVAIDHGNRRLRVASIMTDTYVRIQDYKTNKLSKAYYYDTANGDYTLPCLRQTIHDNFGITPDNYVVVDFSAFQILVNRLGGLNIEVSADEAYYMSNHERYGDFPRFNSAGEYKMSGAEALNYARMRAVGNDDYDRSARQRVVLSKMLSEISKMSTLELAELAYALLPELPTDMTAGDLFGYLTDAADIASYEINEVTFPITNSWRYGTASVRSDEEYFSDPYADNLGTVSGSDVSGSDAAAKPLPTNNKFTVIVTNFQFNSTVLQKFLYENDDSYLNGTAASGIVVPDIIAPLDVSSPAAALTAPAEE